MVSMTARNASRTAAHRAPTIAPFVAAVTLVTLGKHDVRLLCIRSAHGVQGLSPSVSRPLLPPRTGSRFRVPRLLGLRLPDTDCTSLSRNTLAESAAIGGSRNSATGVTSRVECAMNYVELPRAPRHRGHEGARNDEAAPDPHHPRTAGHGLRGRHAASGTGRTRWTSRSTRATPNSPPNLNPRFHQEPGALSYSAHREPTPTARPRRLTTYASVTASRSRTEWHRRDPAPTHCSWGG